MISCKDGDILNRLGVIYPRCGPRLLGKNGSVGVEAPTSKLEPPNSQIKQIHYETRVSGGLSVDEGQGRYIYIYNIHTHTYVTHMYYICVNMCEYELKSIKRSICTYSHTAFSDRSPKPS